MLKNSKKESTTKKTEVLRWNRRMIWAFTMQGGKPFCLICKKLLSQNKDGNVKRHHETNHKNFSRNYLSKFQLRKIKLAELKTSLQNQQTFMTAFSKEADEVTEASFLVTWNIARTKRPYLEDEFAKKIAADVIGVLDPKNKKFQKRIL